MSVGSLQAIAPVPAAPPRYGLLVAAQVLMDEMIAARPPEQSEAVKWQQGIEWLPEPIRGGGVAELACSGGAGLDGIDTDPSIINTAEPFIVAAASQCSTFGWEAMDYEGRAQRQLKASQSYYIAKEFQLGAVRDSQSLQNVALVDAVNVTPSPALPADALAELEGALADRFTGSPGMIHCTPQTFTLLMRDRLIVQTGQLWRTGLGTVVVADAGYAAVSGQEMMYATAPVLVRLGDVLLVPGSLDAARAFATDRSTNLTTIYAERLVLLQLDSSDAATADSMFQVEVDLDPWSLAS